MDQSRLPPELIRAYIETDYQAGGLLLKVGFENRSLKAAMIEHCVSSCVFITAWNPYSEALDDVSNANAHNRLRDEVSFRGWQAIEGFGKHPSNDWPAEVSLLIFGPGLEEARSLGRLFGQNAVVWIDCSAIPQLEILH